MHVKKGDTVEIIRGAHKGKKGVIAKSFPSDGMIIVEGINLKKKHVKPTRNQKGRTIEVAHPMSVSNVRATEAKAKVEKKPKTVKVAKKVTKKAVKKTAKKATKKKKK